MLFLLILCTSSDYYRCSLNLTTFHFTELLIFKIRDVVRYSSSTFHFNLLGILFKHVLKLEM